jgi:hypothetical protein
MRCHCRAGLTPPHRNVLCVSLRRGGPDSDRPDDTRPS